MCDKEKSYSSWIELKEKTYNVQNLQSIYNVSFGGQYKEEVGVKFPYWLFLCLYLQ